MSMKRSVEWLADHQARIAKQRSTPNAELVEVKRIGKQTTVAAIPTPEREVMWAVIEALRIHPGVAWAARMNSGTFNVGDRWIKASFKGCSDIIGQLKDGRLLAVECKSAKGKSTDDQAAFLQHVSDNNGIAFIARSVNDVWVNLSAVQ